MENLECTILYCAVASICTSASPTISTRAISAFSLGSLTAIFFVQATYYKYPLHIQLQNKDCSSHSCHFYILCTRSGGGKKEYTEVKFHPRRSYIVHIGHNPHVEDCGVLLILCHFYGKFVAPS